jgi:hypothetical protein
MPENNYNLINPVEALHNVSQLNPTSQRQHRKRKDSWEKKPQADEEQVENEPENEVENEQNPKNSNLKKLKGHTIDYRA